MQMKVKGQIFVFFFVSRTTRSIDPKFCVHVPYAAWLDNQNTQHQVDNIASRFYEQNLNLRQWMADGVSPNLSQWQVQF